MSIPFSTLDRMAGHIRRFVNRDICQNVFARMPEAKQQALLRLFESDGSSPFTALEAVWVALGDEAADVLDGFASLINKSLLQQRAQEGEPRLVILETIREYGLECLNSSEAMQITQHAHAMHYVSILFPSRESKEIAVSLLLPHCCNQDRLDSM